MVLLEEEEEVLGLVLAVEEEEIVLEPELEARLVLVFVEAPHGLLLVVPFEEQEQEQAVEEQEEVAFGLEAPLVLEFGLGPAVESVLGLEVVQHELLLRVPLESQEQTHISYTGPNAPVTAAKAKAAPPPPTPCPTPHHPILHHHPLPRPYLEQHPSPYQVVSSHRWNSHPS